MKRLALLALLVAACGAAPGVAPTHPAVTTPPPAASIGPTDEPADVSGTGVITFGTALNEDTLQITKATNKFKRTASKIAWSADLTEAAGATSLTLIVASKSASGAERGIIKTDVDISDPTFDLIANSADIATLLDNKAGTYVMRYLRDATVLAEGTFTLVK
jgi:hypothetical protein